MAIETRDIGGVIFAALPMTSYRGTRFWQAQVMATGEILPQHYETRPKLYDDLAQMCRLTGDRWHRCFTPRKVA